ncbi:GPO family capsid scaffolding protein [Sphingomonas oryzagri]
MPKTKSFRVAVEGDTVDGRKIERSWLTDIAATYNRTTYGARVNKEHIVGVTGQEPFKAYGDVLSCSTEEVELELGGKKVKKLALNAEVEATDELVQLVGDKQKIYTSIEVAPNFANTGKAYLMGLAVTDTPASLGTEVLSFAVKNPGLSPHLPRAKAPENVFSLGLETTFAVADAPVAAQPDSETAGLIAAAKQFFASFTKAPEKPADPAQTPANDNDARFTAFGEGIAKMTQAVETMNARIGVIATDVASVKTDHASLKSDLEKKAPASFTQRPPASGGDNVITTDC